MSQDILDRAELFIWRTGRVLERLRFAYLFRGGDPARVVAALRPYQNSDGGFGQGLEPDFRGPVSQPLCIDAALRALVGIHGPDADALLAPGLRYLQTVTVADGGVPNVLPNVEAYPRAPWWVPDPAQRGSLLPTASIAGLLHQRGLRHPWLERATEFCFAALEALPGRIAEARERLPLLQALYELRATALFLDHVPERARAERAAARLGRSLRDEHISTLSGGEAAEPYDFATHPSSLTRAWFEDAQLERALRALHASQDEDGGFPIHWQPFTPSAGLEWRAIQTVDRLQTLRAHGVF